MRPSTRAVSFIVSFWLVWEPVAPMYVTCAPWSYAATSNAERVRVESFSNRSAIVLPMRRRSSPPSRFAALSSAASSSSCRSSSRDESASVRKCRTGSSVTASSSPVEDERAGGGRSRLRRIVDHTAYSPASSQCTISAQRTITVRKSTVSAQSGYCELPTKPSCSKNVRLPTTIANQRAQLARLSNPKPARPTTIPQSRVIQPHVVVSKTMIWFGVTAKYSPRMIAIRPSKKSMPPMITIRQPAKPIHPVQLVFLAITPPCACAMWLTLVRIRSFAGFSSAREWRDVSQHPRRARRVGPRAARARARSRSRACRQLEADADHRGAAGVDLRDARRRRRRHDDGRTRQVGEGRARRGGAHGSGRRARAHRSDARSRGAEDHRGAEPRRLRPDRPRLTRSRPRAGGPARKRERLRALPREGAAAVGAAARRRRRLARRRADGLGRRGRRRDGVGGRLEPRLVAQRHLAQEPRQREREQRDHGSGEEHRPQRDREGLDVRKVDRRRHVFATAAGTSRRPKSAKPTMNPIALVTVNVRFRKSSSGRSAPPRAPRRTGTPRAARWQSLPWRRSRASATRTSSRRGS